MLEKDERVQRETGAQRARSEAVAGELAPARRVKEESSGRCGRAATRRRTGLTTDMAGCGQHGDPHLALRGLENQLREQKRNNLT
jgi:predicted NAD/FAD-dependent oxidoreductase